jgi:SAM-dependent methyltransferase
MSAGSSRPGYLWLLSGQIDVRAAIQRQVARLGHLAGQAWLTMTFRSSGSYWEQRYRLGMTSGAGSCGRAAQFKADFLNEFVREQGVRSVIEIGCGDGQQLALARYPSYIGLDVSRTVVELCMRRFSHDPTKSFLWFDALRTVNLGDFLCADLTISLDVIFHLLEDDVYENHLTNLFTTSRRFVIVYSSNCEDAVRVRHVRHRRFVDDVRTAFPRFTLIQTAENPYREKTFADFHVFRRIGT